MKNLFQSLSSRNVVVCITFFAMLACLLASCGSSRHTGNGYTKHLSHKHNGSHYLNSNNRGCGWSNN